MMRPGIRRGEEEEVNVKVKCSDERVTSLSHSNGFSSGRERERDDLNVPFGSFTRREVSLPPLTHTQSLC